MGGLKMKWLATTILGRQMSHARGFHTSIVDSLKSFSDADLDPVTTSSTIFLDRRWFRLIDAVDLPHLARGELTLHYVVVSSNSELVAVCPFIISRSQTIFFRYSLEKFFFVS